MQLFKDQDIDVSQLASLVDLMDAISLDRVRGLATMAPRQRVKDSPHIVHTLSAIWKARGVAGAKVYLSGRRGARFTFTLFDLETLAPLAFVSSDRLSQLRTGAMGAAVVRSLVPQKQSSLALLGTGTVARGVVECLDAVGELKDRTLYFYSRKKEGRERFLRWKEELGLGGSWVECDNLDEALRETRSVVTTTWSREPLVTAENFSHGRSIVALGSNRPTHREIAPELLKSASLVLVDDREQVYLESGELCDREREVFDYGCWLLASGGGLSEVDSGCAKVGEGLFEVESGLTQAGEGFVQVSDGVRIFKGVGTGLQDLVAMVWLCQKGDDRFSSDL